MNAVWVSRIGELLQAKSRRERREVTVEQLAEYVGVSRQTIHTWKSFRGVKNIPADYTAKLCEFFGVNEWEMWKLVTEESDTQSETPGQKVGVATAVA